MNVKGLTLLEVVLALGLLAIVLLAFTGLQISSLKASSQGRLTQTVVQEAQNLLENLRAQPGSIPSQCGSGIQVGGLRATCSYQACEINGTTLSCGGSISNPSLYRVTLNIPEERPRLELSTLVYLP